MLRERSQGQMVYSDQSTNSRRFDLPRFWNSIPRVECFWINRNGLTSILSSQRGRLNFTSQSRSESKPRQIQDLINSQASQINVNATNQIKTTHGDAIYLFFRLKKKSNDPNSNSNYSPKPLKQFFRYSRLLSTVTILPLFQSHHRNKKRVPSNLLKLDRFRNVLQRWAAPQLVDLSYYSSNFLKLWRIPFHKVVVLWRVDNQTRCLVGGRWWKEKAWLELW